MKKQLAMFIICTMLCGTAYAMSRKPANEGSTVNVYVNNATAKSEAFWKCWDDSFKNSSKLDANGKVIPGMTDWAKVEELRKSCGSPV